MSTLTEVTDGNFSTEVLGVKGPVLSISGRPGAAPAACRPPYLKDSQKN